jgi:hypothetical protein
MANEHTPTIDEIVPNITSQLILKGALRKSFPADREEIEQHLHAFAAASIRCSRIEPDMRSLHQYFLQECGWNEFQAIWYRSRIEEFLVIARTTKRLENLGE